MTAFFMEPWQPLHRNAIIAGSGRVCYACKVAEKDPMVAGCRKYIYLTPSMRRTALSMILHSLVWHESVVNSQRKRAEFEFIDERKERRNCHVRH